MRRAGLASALIVVAIVTTGIVFAAEREIEMQPGDTLIVECPTRLSGIVRGERSTIRCIGEAVATATGTVVATATRTATSVVTATQTAVSTATATVAALTATPLATQTQTPTSTGTPPPGGTGVCTTHNPTQWHGLSGPSGCHYEHEHGDDPSVLNGMFGQPGAWAGVSQSISYPWQTFGPNGTENQIKHDGYKWIVRQGLPSQPSGGEQGYLTDYRTLVHAQGSASDAITRFHSASFEGRGCLGSVCGTIKTGSWHDFGHLALLNGSGGQACPSVATNPSSFTCGDGPRRNHFDTSPAAAMNRNAAWYPGFAQLGGEQGMQLGQPWAAISLSFHDIFGPTSASNPSQQLFYPHDWFGNNLYNNSMVSMNELFLVMDYRQGNHTQRSPADVAAIDPDGDHVANFNGYTDRYGNRVASCSVGLDCVPLQIVGLPMVGYHYRDDIQGTQRSYPKEHDNSPAMQHPTESGYPEWIRFPN